MLYPQSLTEDLVKRLAFPLVRRIVDKDGYTTVVYLLTYGSQILTLGGRPLTMTLPKI